MPSAAACPGHRRAAVGCQRKFDERPVRVMYKAMIRFARCVFCSAQSLSRLNAQRWRHRCAAGAAMIRRWREKSELQSRTATHDKSPNWRRGSRRSKRDPTAGSQLDEAQRTTKLARAVERDSERYKELSTRHGQTTDPRDAKATFSYCTAPCRNAIIGSPIADPRTSHVPSHSELLAAYRDKDAWDALKQAPMTGIASCRSRMPCRNTIRLEDLRTVESGRVSPAETTRHRRCAHS